MRHFPYPITIRVLNGWIEVGAPDFGIVKAKKRFEDISTATDIGKLVIEVLDEAVGRVSASSRSKTPLPAPSKPKGAFDVEANLASDPIRTMEVQKILGVSHETVRRLSNSGKLVPVKTVGGHRRFKLSEVQRYLEDQCKVEKGHSSESLRQANSNARFTECPKPSGEQ